MHVLGRDPQGEGFLSNYSALKPGDDHQAERVYIAPNVDWAKYTKMIVDPVMIWRGTEGRSRGLSQREAQIGELRQQNPHLEDALRQAQAASSAGADASSVAEYEAAKARIAELEQQLDAAKKENADLEEELEAAMAELEELQA